MFFFTEFLPDVWNGLVHPDDWLSFTVSLLLLVTFVALIVFVSACLYAVVDESMGKEVSGTGKVIVHGVEGAYMTPMVSGKTIVNISHPATYWLEIEAREYDRKVRQQVSAEEWMSTADGSQRVWSARIGRFTNEWY